MHNQQLVFSLVFTFLGSLLGWFSHSAFMRMTEQPISSTAIKNDFETKKADVILKPELPAVATPVSESITSPFVESLKKNQYVRALEIFKNNEQHKSYYTQLQTYMNELVTESRWNDLVQLADIFLAEYYNDVILLQYKARAMTKTGQYYEAITTLYLAKNYAINNTELIQIELLIYDLSQRIYTKHSDDKRWYEAIQLFELFIENEPDYSFFHMRLAELYIQTNNYEQAILHLQLLTSDAEYGSLASKMLQDLYSNESQKSIKLTKSNSHYFVSVLISGDYQVNLMIDTGASLTILSPEIIEQLVHSGQANLSGTNQMFTAGGVIDADIYTIKNMSIGLYSVNNIKTAELKLDQNIENSQPIDGLLGMSFLNQFNFSIDQDNQRLFLSPK